MENRINSSAQAAQFFLTEFKQRGFLSISSSLGPFLPNGSGAATKVFKYHTKGILLSEITFWTPISKLE